MAGLDDLDARVAREIAEIVVGRARRRPPRTARVGPVSAQGLPLAVGLLRASEQLPDHPLEGAAFLGQLSFDGALRHTPGIRPMALVAREAGLRRAHGAAPVDGIEVVRSRCWPAWSTSC